MIYIASPYSSPILEAQAHRFEAVRRFTAHCLAQGIMAFSPIVYAHEMAGQFNFKTDAQSWVRFNSDMLRRCEAVFVYCLPGWDTSKGVKVELGQAKALLMEVAYFNEDFSPRQP